MHRRISILFLVLNSLLSFGQDDLGVLTEEQQRIADAAGSGGTLDTLNLNITSSATYDCDFGTPDPKGGTRYVNNIDFDNLDDVTGLAPHTMYNYLYSVGGDSVGPLIRTSDTLNESGIYNNGTYTYDSLCANASSRMIRVRNGDSLTITIGGFVANAVYEVGIFGGGPFGSMGEFDVRIGTDNYTSTTMNSQGNALERFTGNSNGNGVLTISLHSPVETYLYAKIIQVYGEIP